MAANSSARVLGLLDAAVLVGEAQGRRRERQQRESAPDRRSLHVSPADRDLRWVLQAGALEVGRVLAEGATRWRVVRAVHRGMQVEVVLERDLDAEERYLASRRAEARLLGVEWEEDE